MDHGLPDILEQCLARMEGGATVEECLSAFPAQRAELEPPLRVAAHVRDLPRPPLPPATRAALETKMLALAAARRAAPATNGAYGAAPAAQRPWRAIRPAALLARLLRAIGYRGPLYQPWLHVVALAATIVLALVLSAGALAAARAIGAVVRPQPTAVPTSTPASRSLDGPIEQIAQERWLVAGQVVVIGATTAIDGAPAIGRIAHINGTLSATGALLAQRIRIEAAQPTPSATPTRTVAPPVAPTSVPALLRPAARPPRPPAAAPALPRPTAAPPQDNGAKDRPTCQGQQRGRDEKKCDPKPKPPKKDAKPKDAKPKDGGGKPKK